MWGTPFVQGEPSNCEGEHMNGLPSIKLKKKFN